LFLKKVGSVGFYWLFVCWGTCVGLGPDKVFGLVGAEVLREALQLHLGLRPHRQREALADLHVRVALGH
jgi:hypothetical protein